MSLRALLDDGRRFDAEYAGGLSNHLPMALVALASLGADDARLAAFAQHYAQRLAPAPAPVGWPAGDAWASRLGELESFAAYRDLFEQWIGHESAASVLQQALPVLMVGVGANAFHGIIRTGCAVRAGHHGELANGLAYWACRWLDLGMSRAAGRTLDPARLLARLAPLAGRADLIYQRMQLAAATPGFAAVVNQFKVTDDTLQRLARLAARLYAGSGNFTALHLVTSAHAMRLLMPFVEDPAPALRSYWRAFAAGVMAAGLQAGEPPASRPWPDLVAAAIASPDEHLVKLVDSCREEQRAYGGAEDWQRAATCAVDKAAASA